MIKNNIKYIFLKKKLFFSMTRNYITEIFLKTSIVFEITSDKRTTWYKML